MSRTRKDRNRNMNAPSHFKKTQKRIRRAKVKHALRSGIDKNGYLLKELPKFRMTDLWDWW